MPRIAPAPAKGLFRKYVYREARKRFDRDLEPMAVMGHSKKLLLAAGGFELPLEKFKAVDKKLVALAEIKAALLVGCEFCIDIGSFIGAREGLTDEQLLAIPRHREATCFNEVERLVLDFAEGMSRTPTVVTDDLFAQLREHFDERQLVLLIAFGSMMVATNVFNDAMGVPLDDYLQPYRA